MRPDGSRETVHIFTFSSSDHRAQTSKMRFNGRANVSLLSFPLFFSTRIAAICLAHTGKLNVAGWLTSCRTYLRDLSRISRLLAAKRKYIFASRRRCAISEKLIIHLRRRYVFPVDARCAFNAFAAAGSMRSVLPSSLSLSLSLSLLSLFLFPLAFLPSRAIPLSCADWKPDTQSRLNQ